MKKIQKSKGRFDRGKKTFQGDSLHHYTSKTYLETLPKNKNFYLTVGLRH